MLDSTPIIRNSVPIKSQIRPIRPEEVAARNENDLIQDTDLANKMMWPADGSQGIFELSLHSLAKSLKVMPHSFTSNTLDDSSHAKPQSWHREAPWHFGRGFLMGAADIVPGVSGGTVALIVGIYTRLVTAISHVDRHLLKLIRTRQWRAAATHLDLALLGILAPGILCGMAAMTWWMHHLMTDLVLRSYTLAVFFGIILASSFLIARLIQVPDRQTGLKTAIFGVIGTAITLALSYFHPGHVEPSLVYLFFCGIVGISAMILPGISGAMILLIMGVYLYLTGTIYELLHAESIAANLLIVVVFGSGCLTGLLSFSKLLRWLLQHHGAVTMALLCGFMIGALRKLWPFQNDLTPSEEELKLKEFQVYWPESWGASEWRIVGIGLAAALTILALDFFGQRLKTRSQTP